jgi:outer membrane receptor protein involved in Fe transport
VFKLFGSYNLTDHWRIGGNFLMQSGRPKNCQGFVPSNVPDFDPIDGLGGAGSYTSASSFYCLKEDGSGESELVERGRLGRTDWTYTLNASVAYVHDLGPGELTLQMNVYNIFNSHTVQEYNETRDFSRQSTELNPNYGLPTSFQTPRSVQFVARWEF